MVVVCRNGKRSIGMEEPLSGNVKGPGVRLHENISLIEVADRISLDVILADATAQKCLLTRLSDTVAIVAPGRYDALLARLLRLGHTPKVLAE